MELMQYFQLIRRWWWLLLFAAIIVGGITYTVGRSEPPIYQASVKVFIGSYIENPNPGSGEIATGTNLASTYSNLITVRPILEATIATLGLDISPGQLAGSITVVTVPSTSILTITVTDGNGVQAANIANELANQLILNSPTNLTPEQDQRRQIIEAETVELSSQIVNYRTELNEIEAQRQVATGFDELESLDVRRSILLSQISDSQQTLAELSNSISSLSSQINTLRVVEPALVPINPVASNLMQRTLVGALVGVVLAFGVILLLEYLDNTFRTPDEVRQLLEVPVLAVIARFGKRRDNYKDKLIMISAPHSAPVEGYRALRTNLLYSLNESPTRRLVVTSAQMSEGKTVTAGNLAVALARAEIKTVLIDTDLHRPRVHNMFDLDNKIGVSNLFSVNLKNNQLLSIEDLNQILQPTEIPNLQVITSGSLPSNPAELLGLPHLSVLCNSLEKNLGIEAIIFDTPPTLSVIDSPTIAYSTSASVIIVIEAKRTRRDNILRAFNQFKQINVNVIGAVLNGMTNDAGGYYYYYGYGNYRQAPKKTGRFPFSSGGSAESK